MQIGFIGLGSMGSAMALNLVKAGHEVRAWNRSKVAQDRVPGVIRVELAAEAVGGRAQPQDRAHGEEPQQRHGF